MGAGCEMFSLILELQTCQLGLCFAQVVTFIDPKCLFNVLFCYTSRNNPRKKDRKVLFGDIDFSTSIHFISDIISSKSARAFDSARQVKSIGHWLLDSISSLLDRLSAR